jgi:hypothetical protein
MIFWGYRRYCTEAFKHSGAGRLMTGPRRGPQRPPRRADPRHDAHHLAGFHQAYAMTVPEAELIAARMGYTSMASWAKGQYGTTGISKRLMSELKPSHRRGAGSCRFVGCAAGHPPSTPGRNEGPRACAPGRVGNRLRRNVLGSPTQRYELAGKAKLARQQTQTPTS